MNIKDLKVNECCGCAICEAVCPKDAIKIVLTDEGFYEPVINEEKCVNCSVCTKTCYKGLELDIKKPYKDGIETYSAYNNDAHDRYHSSSGGLASVLAKQCIADGYTVVGVEYDYIEEIAKTSFAKTEEEVYKFSGSKYFQSKNIDALKAIMSDGKDTKYAIFGTPCQIYALRKYARDKKCEERFLFVDIFCHGCPSLKLWEKYLAYIKKKSKFDKFDSIEFRSKRAGWHEYVYVFKSGEREYVTKKNFNMFYTMFFDKNILCRACYDCRVRSSFDFPDIRIGDFWGKRFDTNADGVSAVVVCTQRGKELFQKIEDKISFERQSLEEVVAWQSFGKTHSCDEKLRAVALGEFKKDTPF